MIVEDGGIRSLRCVRANKHDLGFLRVELKKIDEMPVINGICALAQIVKLFGDTVVEEDRIKARVIRVLLKRHVEVLNDVGHGGEVYRSWRAGGSRTELWGTPARSAAEGEVPSLTYWDLMES